MLVEKLIATRNIVKCHRYPRRPNCLSTAYLITVVGHSNHGSFIAVIRGSQVYLNFNPACKLINKLTTLALWSAVMEPGTLCWWNGKA